MSRVLIIGAGGVGNVVAQKCASADDIFSNIFLASRNIEKCNIIKKRIKNNIEIFQVDANKTDQLVKLILQTKPDLIINVALPYQDLTIMDACLETGVNYIDTANYESEQDPNFCYKWQWDYHEKFKNKGIMALLGCGFDPGVTNIFCAYANKKHFDNIHYIDIMDCNAGDHGHPFATNFNPEINIREISHKGKFYEDGKWIETEPLSIFKEFKFPEIGKRKMYLLYHEELESIVKNIKGIKRIRFFMTFTDQYLTHLKVLQNIGMTRIDPVLYNGVEIIPLKFLKTLLPDPATLGTNYKGKTCIGCMIDGLIKGKKRKYYIYNVCSHEESYKETGSQAVSYTTGVPAMIGALLMLKGIWKGQGVFNVEEFDPYPFMEYLQLYGLKWVEKFIE